MISASAVTEFLQSYLSSFDDMSGARLAGHYHLPSVMTRADGSVHCFSDPESTQRTLSAVAKAYLEQGARLWRYLDLAIEPIGRRSVLASVDWLMLDEHGNLLKRWRHSYNLIESAGRLQILEATFNVT